MIDRSHDISRPLADLSPDERLKDGSRQLRGTIAQGLADRLTWGVPGTDVKLMKFHGIYQQDDRDLRDERRHQKLEPAFQFMVRVRLPGGVCTPERWLKLTELALKYGGQTLRMTTRQTVQFHWVLKHDLVAVIRGLREVALDTIAACGDDSRGVMCTADPQFASLQAELAALSKQVSDEVIPKTHAYQEIWYGADPVEASASEEAFYGRTYMPRKFKIGFVIPPSNDIDVYAQDLGYIAIANGNGLEGFNVAIGGGMGRTDRAPQTYPRLADVIGFIPKERLMPVTQAIMTVQRDYGNRADRARARFKYTIDDKGLPWVKKTIEDLAGGALAPARPYAFTSNGDRHGWTASDDGRHHFTLFVENGRLDRETLVALGAIARAHKGHFRLTPNQNLIIANVADSERETIDDLLEAQGLAASNRRSLLRLNAMACVAFPTCGLAMAESERYLPDLLTGVDAILAKHGIENEPITIRMTGCPNGCARPYIAEIGLTGRAPGKYNLYLGGGFHGQRLNQLYKENIGEPAILATLDDVLGRYAAQRLPAERFGDFTVRAGIAREDRGDREVGVGQ